jgi:hypothetical protein
MFLLIPYLYFSFSFAPPHTGCKFVLVWPGILNFTLQLCTKNYDICLGVVVAHAGNPIYGGGSALEDWDSRQPR